MYAQGVVGARMTSEWGLGQEMLKGSHGRVMQGLRFDCSLSSILFLILIPNPIYWHMIDLSEGQIGSLWHTFATKNT